MAKQLIINPVGVAGILDGMDEKKAINLFADILIYSLSDGSEPKEESEEFAKAKHFLTLSEEIQKSTNE